ncbi:MAG: hypothetical protein ACLT1W_13280 [Alistipes onderdonkii]
MLSREKLLFCADSTQNIQYPSRRMNGPCCPVSELTALSSILRTMRLTCLLRRKRVPLTRVRNLDVVEQGGTWRNAMHLYRATGKPGYLKKAVAGADLYIRRRIDTPAAAGRNSTRSTRVLPRCPGPGYFGQSRREGPALPIPQVERTCADGRSCRTGSAWRLSEIGLYPGILRNGTGHRGIFMATYAHGCCGWRITRDGFWHARRTTPS